MPVIRSLMASVTLVALLAVGATTAIAQDAPPRRVRIGVAGTAPAPAPAPAPLAPPVVYVMPSYGAFDGYVTTGAPYLVLSDGSVAVNFGRGYERVLRPCAAAPSAQPADPWARDALGRIPEPPGIAALRAGTRGAVGGSMPAATASACYRPDSSGRPVVVQGH
ncbi:MAG: hypothetical protein H0W68_14865 [Gemmatimonadaceae bacterium]|nr:hypothetical protein [Gemmatimonadaceae bacterium]